MNIQLTKTKRILFVIAVMLSNCAIMGDSPLYTISNDLYNAWPNQSAILNYALSGPPLILMLASLAAPFILKIMSKKKLLVTGAALFTVGSIFSVTIPTALWFAGMRTLVGMGQGFIQVTAIALMTEVFYEENERNKYMGFYNASNNVIGIFYNYFAGHWAAVSYISAFRIYYISIPMLIMAILFVPELAKEEKEEQVKEAASSGVKEGFGGKFWSISAILLVYYIINMVLAYFRSVFVAEQGMGNSILNGYISIAGQISSFVICMSFGPLMKFLKKWALTFGAGLLLIVYCLYQFLPSVPTMFCCQIIQMMSYGLIYTYHMSVVPSYAPESRRTTAIALVAVVYGLGTFLSTYTATFLMNFTEGLFSPTVKIYIILMAVVTAITVVFAMNQKEKA